MYLSLSLSLHSICCMEYKVGEWSRSVTTRLQKKMVLLLWMMTSLHLFLVFWNFQVLLCTHAIYVLIRQVDLGFLDLPWYLSLAWSLEPRKWHLYFWVLDLGVGCFTQYLHFSLSVHYHWRLRRRHLAQKFPPTSQHEINSLASSFLLNVGFQKKDSVLWFLAVLETIKLFPKVLAMNIFSIEVEPRMWHRWLYRWILWQSWYPEKCMIIEEAEMVYSPFIQKKYHHHFLYRTLEYARKYHCWFTDREFQSHAPLGSEYKLVMFSDTWFLALYAAQFVLLCYNTGRQNFWAILTQYEREY